MFVPLQVGNGNEGCGKVETPNCPGIVNTYTMEASFMGLDQILQRCEYILGIFSEASVVASK